MLPPVDGTDNQQRADRNAQQRYERTQGLTLQRGKQWLENLDLDEVEHSDRGIGRVVPPVSSIVDLCSQHAGLEGKLTPCCPGKTQEVDKSGKIRDVNPIFFFFK